MNHAAHHRPPRRDDRRPRRAWGPPALGVCMVASLVAPVLLGVPDAGAAPTDPTQLVLRDVAGTRVARAGATGTVRATVANEGSAPATGVEVRYRLPDGVDAVVAASTSGCTVSSRLVTCAVGTLSPSATAPVEIAVREPDTTAVLGTRAGYFFAPTSDDYDVGAGEILQTTWYHEAGGEGTALAGCWPIDNPTPNMDVAGGACDGTDDAPALTPDETDVLDAFPEPFSESLIRSWQFETEIVAPRTGQYRACGELIDDGGYLAVTPVGQAFTPASVRVEIDSYTSSVGTPFTLNGGERYRVLMRVSNRGGVGVDNGTNNGALAGWDAYGIAPASEPCGVPDAAVFGSGPDAWTKRTVADVVVVGSSDLDVLGAVESAPVDGARSASVRVVNAGSDATSALLHVLVPAGGSLSGPPTGCDRVASADASRCELDSVVPTAPGAKGRVVSLSFTGPAGLAWSLSPTDTVDRDPSNDDGGLGSD